MALNLDNIIRTYLFVLLSLLVSSEVESKPETYEYVAGFSSMWQNNEEFWPAFIVGVVPKVNHVCGPTQTLGKSTTETPYTQMK